MGEFVRWNEWDKSFNPAAIGMRCNIPQYLMLKRCSDANDTSEWNNWRKANPKEEIWLCGAPLTSMRLDKINLTYSHLEGSKADGILLRHAQLQHAQLEGATLREARMERAHLDNAGLFKTRLSRARLNAAIANDANFLRADLAGAELYRAKLHRANFEQAVLKSTNLSRTELASANFTLAVVDGETKLWEPTFDRNTNFEGVGLGNVRMDPASKEALPSNIRQERWREWFHKGNWGAQFLKSLFVQTFWWISDYGRSTRRIIATFLLLAVVFGLHYWGKPECVVTTLGVGQFATVWHAMYFSVVTMTTLGFGDIHANPASTWGQTVLMCQVIFGYILLGALVTRFAILFSGEGPAAKPLPLAETDKQD